MALIAFKNGNLVRDRRHRSLAVVLAFALALSQGVVAAYACPIDDMKSATRYTDARNADPMPDCDAMPAQGEPAANRCQTHCLVGQQVQSDNAVFAPVAIVAPLIVRMMSAIYEGRVTFLHAEVPLPTPPPLLRFTRLLN